MKIATLLPSATEIVCALGLRDSLVAVSHECDYPQDVTTLPPITSSILGHDLSPLQIDEAVVKAVHEGQALYQVDGDLLSVLQPNLIITQGVCDVCAVNQGTVEQTMKFLPDVIAKDVQVLSLSGGNFAGVLRDIGLVASAAQVQERGEQLIDELKQQWDRLKTSGSNPKPKVLMLEWPDPFFFGGHWVPEMVEAAGGIDILGQVGIDSGRCTAQDIVERDPDIIISIACGFDLEKNVEFANKVQNLPELQHVTAIKNNQVWAIDANSYFSRPAPRIIDGVIKLKAIFASQPDGVIGVRQIKS